MTNGQKAREIADKNERFYGGEYESFNECYKAAMEMAEWKEQQMIDWVRKNAYRYIDTDNDSEGHLCERFFEDAFIDDFKKAMKGK